MCTDFVELHGDRNVKDDKAMVGGFAKLDGETVMILEFKQKGINTKMRQIRNFGMGQSWGGTGRHWELMKLAEKFNKPVITLIDTPGAYPGLEAEERGRDEAINPEYFWNAAAESACDMCDYWRKVPAVAHWVLVQATVYLWWKTLGTLLFHLKVAAVFCGVAGIKEKPG